MSEEKLRREQFLIRQQGFKTNAFKIIKEMVDLCNKTPGSKHLVDEILHSIFFLGQILDPNGKIKFPPEEIIPDKNMLETLEEKYPKPFEFYQTQLPRRSPFSCVLDMIVLQHKPENEAQIKQSLSGLVKSLEPKFLVSSTICVSKSNKTGKQYGASMSTTGPNAGRVIIAASCLSGLWDEYVAGAVMTYYPKMEKKQYFDGTIKLPSDVSCNAFNSKSQEEIPPCGSCVNLFGLDPTDERNEDKWPYGNCAEVESLSNLFKRDQDVKTRAKPTSPTCTQVNRDRAREEVKKTLKQILNMIQFKKWKGEFYEAQS